MQFLCILILAWESLALLQGSFGPFGPKVANRVRKWVPGPSRPRGPKSPKRSRKRVKIDYFSTILTLFRLRFGLFGPWGRKGPGTHFRTLFATFGPKGPNDPCSGQKFSQILVLVLVRIVPSWFFGSHVLHSTNCRFFQTSACSRFVLGLVLWESLFVACLGKGNHKISEDHTIQHHTHDSIGGERVTKNTHQSPRGISRSTSSNPFSFFASFASELVCVCAIALSKSESGKRGFESTGPCEIVCKPGEDES